MEYILSSFWTWMGAVILVCLVAGALRDIVSAFGPRRKVKVSQRGDFITVEIENASEHDVRMALADVSRNAEVISNGEEHDSYD